MVSVVNIIVGLLHSQPLHGLELISLSAISDSKCCIGNTVSAS